MFRCVPLGLPQTIRACLFDLDGVITQTAKVHARAWKQVFDEFLQTRGQPAFDPMHDYDDYVDGKPRTDNEEDLARKDIREGEEVIVLRAGDVIPQVLSPAPHVAERKDRLFLDLIHRHGVQTYDGTVRYVHSARAAGLKVAVVSSSKHTTDVLRAAKLDGLFDGQVDGNVAEREHLRGKPAPDTYLKAAEMLDATAPKSAVYEDALAGVEAGRAGGFGLVIGIDRVGQAEALRRHGADIVVNDLAELMAD